MSDEIILRERIDRLEAEAIELRQEIRRLKHIINIQSYDDDYPMLALADAVLNSKGVRIRGSKNKIVILPGREGKIGRVTKTDSDHVLIYAFVDPRNKVVRYIGHSQNLRARFIQHKQNATYHNSTMAWIRDLDEYGIGPVMVILDLVPESDGDKEERRWIKECLRHGWPLVNIHGVPTEWRAS